MPNNPIDSKDLFPCCARAGLAVLLADLFRALQRKRAMQRA
ncbi:hypothetical protein QTI66_17795 [Variovorax sp. J22R133]|nr:hypothetical protein [Variovorax sp. J22R133]MDM0114011.1 hypothetical protein [Variovorax sp. J22R133]